MNLYDSLVRILRSPHKDSISIGTGFFVTSTGYILTCYHVIRELGEPKEVWLFWKEHLYPRPAKVCYKWCNQNKDYAILKLPIPKKSSIQLSSFGTVWKLGDEIYSEGYQYVDSGFGKFPAYGIIRGLTTKDDYACPLIVVENSTNIQSGISGAPALNKNMERVIGIITAKWQETNTAFLIPLKDVVADLRTHSDIDQALSNFIQSLHTLPDGLQQIFDYLRNITTDPNFKDWDRQHYFDLELSENIVPYNIKMRLANTEQLSARGAKNKYTIHEAIESFERCIIIGEPGSGKTTALKRMTIVYAENCLKEIQTDEYLKNHYIPIYIQLSHYPFVIGNTPYERICSFVNESFQNAMVPLTQKNPMTFLREFKLILFCDGLNEMAETAIDSLVEGLEIFKRNHPKHLLVITSRLHNFHNFSFGKYQFPILELLELKYPENIKEYLECYLPCKSDIDNFLEELHRHQRIRKLAVNPLLLYMMIIVFQKEKGKLPHSRGQLFAKIANGVLGEWEIVKKDSKRENEYSIRDKHELLVPLGHTMKSEGLELPISKIEEIFREALKHRGPRRVYNGRAEYYSPLYPDADFTKVIGELKKNRLLQDTGKPNILKFWHQTIQEYFAACQIAEEAESFFNYNRRVMKWRLNTYIKDSRWHEIFAIATGLINRQCQERFIDYIWKRNTLLAAMCISNTERTLPDNKIDVYVNKLKIKILWLGLKSSRVCPWVVGIFLGIFLLNFPVERLDSIFYLVINSIYVSERLPQFFISYIFIPLSFLIIAMFIGILVSIMYFRLLAEFTKAVDFFVNGHYLRRAVSSLVYIRTESVEKLLSELRILVKKDFWVGEIVRNTIKAAQAIPVNDEDELLLLLENKETRVQAIELLGENGSLRAIKPLIKILEDDEDIIENIVIDGTLEALVKIGKTAEEKYFVDIREPLIQEMDNDKKNSYGKRRKIYQALREMGITDIVPPVRTRIIRDYIRDYPQVIGILTFVLLLAFFLLH